MPLRPRSSPGSTQASRKRTSAGSIPLITIPEPASLGSFSVAIPDLRDLLGLTICLLVSSAFEGQLSYAIPDTVIRKRTRRIDGCGSGR